MSGKSQGHKTKREHRADTELTNLGGKMVDLAGTAVVTAGSIGIAGLMVGAIPKK